MNTDVVILGMPSSGKTVFLSVLGHKFNLPVDKGSPLGFRMYPRGEHTRRMVETNFSDLSVGKWPPSTPKGQTTDLEWDIFTGNRKLFCLSSMDISGETFREAYGRGNGSYKETGPDALLGSRNSNTAKSYNATQLVYAVNNAKVVCLFVNITTAQNDIQRENFNETMVAMCNMLDQSEELCQKTIIVLTQSHTHANEIERAGGAVPYLDSNQSAHDLYVIVKNKHIPVLAVSAVNEEPGSGNRIPRNFKSEGLFGFLLTVSGMVAPELLGDLKNNYLNFLSAKAGYFQNPFRTICDRIKLVRKFADAGQALYLSCMDYIANPGNFELVDNESEDASVILNEYRNLTEHETEIVLPAKDGWKTRLKCDEAWNGHLKQSAYQFCNDGTRPTSQQLINIVHNTLGIKSDEAIFGFSEHELKAQGGKIESYEDWVDKCLEDLIPVVRQEIDRKQKLEARIRIILKTTTIVIGAVLSLILFRLIVNLCLGHGNSKRVSKMSALVEQGEYEQAADVAAGMNDSVLFGVRASDYIPEDTEERLRAAAPITPLLKNLQYMGNRVIAIADEVQASDFVPSGVPDNLLAQGVKMAEEIQAPGWRPALPTLEDFTNAEVSVGKLTRALYEINQKNEKWLQEVAEFVFDWDQLKRCCEKRLKKLNSHFNPKGGIREKAILAGECQELHTQISNLVNDFKHKYSNVIQAGESKADEFETKAKEVIEALPYLVKIVAVSVSTSHKVDIEKTTWFGRGLPDMANDVDPLTGRKCIFMLVKPEEKDRSYRIPVKLNGQKYDNSINFRKHPLKPGLNQFETTEK